MWIPLLRRERGWEPSRQQHIAQHHLQPVLDLTHSALPSDQYHHLRHSPNTAPTPRHHCPPPSALQPNPSLHSLITVYQGLTALLLGTRDKQPSPAHRGGTTCTGQEKGLTQLVLHMGYRCLELSHSRWVPGTTCGITWL